MQIQGIVKGNTLVVVLAYILPHIEARKLIYTLMKVPKAKELVDAFAYKLLKVEHDTLSEKWPL